MTFDWHKEPEESFLHWLVVTLIPTDRPTFSKIEKATNNFTEVDLTVQINGISVNIDSFVQGIERNMELEIEREVKIKIQEMADMDGIVKAIEDIQLETINRLHELAKNAGIEIDREY